MSNYGISAPTKCHLYPDTAQIPEWEDEPRMQRDCRGFEPQSVQATED